MLTTIIMIAMLAAGAAGWGMYLHSRSLAKRKAILRERLSHLSAPVEPALFEARFRRSLERAQRSRTAEAAVQAELDQAEWEGSRAR